MGGPVTDYNPVCPHCGHHTVYKPAEWVEGGPLMCANPMCDSNHPPEEPDR